MIIEARAPTRVDLAGGTLDIHPIHLVEQDVWTINAAIDIPVSVRLATARKGFTISSQDLHQRVRADTLDTLPTGGPLDLACRALRFAAPKTGVTITLNSTAPPGSGLGASSALLVTLLAALDRLGRRSRRPEDLVAVAWRLETQSVRTLTGRQDHLAAVHGGVNAIYFGLDGDRVEPLLTTPSMRAALQDRLVLVYTGQPHASAITNWSVVRAYLDGAPDVISRMRSIAAVARQMREALRAQDLNGIGELLAEEWTHRRELAPGVSTPEIEKALSVARRHGAIGGKACGAGGGGCVVIFTRDGARRTIESQLRGAGYTVLKMEIAAKGLQVRTVSS
jgi:D-glycero-alpha-D-manno-heptose-7-phosphate kinase